jgi:hypothetical protein
MSPGPAVTPMASTCPSSPRPRRGPASTTSSSTARWARAASSGTTPPQTRCTSCERITCPRSSRSPAEDGGGGLVAGGLDSQDQRRVGSHGSSRSTSTGSTRARRRAGRPSTRKLTSKARPTPGPGRRGAGHQDPEARRGPAPGPGSGPGHVTVTESGPLDTPRPRRRTRGKGAGSRRCGSTRGSTRNSISRAMGWTWTPEIRAVSTRTGPAPDWVTVERSRGPGGWSPGLGPAAGTRRPGTPGPWAPGGPPAPGSSGSSPVKRSAGARVIRWMGSKPRRTVPGEIPSTVTPGARRSGPTRAGSPGSCRSSTTSATGTTMLGRSEERRRSSSAGPRKRTDTVPGLSPPPPPTPDRSGPRAPPRWRSPAGSGPRSGPRTRGAPRCRGPRASASSSGRMPARDHGEATHPGGAG